MRIVIVNGSPRKGNTLTAIQALVEGAKEKNEIEIIEANKVDMKPCQGCGACQCYKGCVAKDDTNPVIDKLVEADLIVFATPVYWWGMTAQLKLVIDKCYCRGAQLKGKRIGLIVTGGSPVESIQYRLINEQFACMAEFLKWDIEFTKSYFANAKDELSNRPEVLDELRKIGSEL